MSVELRALLKRVLPAPVRSTLRRGWERFGWPITERTDVWLGRRGPMVPPARLSRFVGSGDFREIGEVYLRCFIELGGLRPTDRVLDVGCGIGRMAVPLTGHLTTGSYDGFDIVPVAIKWCARHITPRYPSFRFHLADLCNTAYHPEGRYRAADYRFPFADASFDFVLLVSVLTHLLPREATNYLHEVTRVLRPGGRCFMTWFLLDEESLQQIRAGTSLVAFFPSGEEGCMVADPRNPGDVTAHSEAAVRALSQDCGLLLQEPVHYGSWRGRERALTHQDILIALKPG